MLRGHERKFDAPIGPNTIPVRKYAMNERRRRKIRHDGYREGRRDE